MACNCLSSTARFIHVDFTQSLEPKSQSASMKKRVRVNKLLVDGKPVIVFGDEGKRSTRHPAGLWLGRTKQVLAEDHLDCGLAIFICLPACYSG